MKSRDILLVIILCTAAQANASDLCSVRGLEAEGIHARSIRLEWSDPYNQAALEMRLNGKRIEPGYEVREDGQYLLEVFGNGPTLEAVACPPRSFTVDTTPPELRFHQPSWLPAGAAPRLEVTEANPSSQPPEFFLNGEPFDPTQPLPPGEYQLEAVVFDAAGHRSSETTTYERPGTCLPTSWTEYQPASARLSAAHYFPWYTATASCPANHPWCNCFSNPKPQNPRPARGFYSSSDQAVVNAQLAQMAAHGIDVVSLEWTGETTQENNLLQRVIPRVGAYGMKFIVFYDTGVRLIPNNFSGEINFDDLPIRNRFISDFQKFASSTSYYKHPSYLKFNNQPVIYVWISRAITGSQANIQAAFDAAHQAARNSGFGGLYLVADHLFWDNPDATPLFWMGAKAVTSFAPVDNNQGIAQGSAGRPMRQWANRMSGLYSGTVQRFSGSGWPAVDLQPGIWIQIDQRGLETPQCFSIPTTSHFHLVDGSDFSYMIDVAGTPWTQIAETHLLRRNCSEWVVTNGTNGASIVWTYSYNEWYEGAGIEDLEARNPPYPYGFGLAPLQILKQKLP